MIIRSRSLNQPKLRGNLNTRAQRAIVVVWMVHLYTVQARCGGLAHCA
jgi:hypothetical protein